MEILNFENYIIPVVLGICLVVGWILKKWVKDVDNKFIPLIVTLLGAVLAILGDDCKITLDTVFCGLITGASSTGMHQIFKQMVEEQTRRNKK